MARPQKMPHEALMDHSTLGSGMILRQLAGLILLIIGVSLGVYVAFAAFGIINGEERPGLVSQFADPLGDRMLDSDVAAEVLEKLDKNGRTLEQEPTDPSENFENDGGDQKRPSQKKAKLTPKQKSEIEVSEDLKKMFLYGLTFFFLFIPASVAGGLVKSGANLLLSDSAHALKQIAEKLKSD